MPDERYKQYKDVIPGCGGEYLEGSASYKDEQKSKQELEYWKQRSNMTAQQFVDEYFKSKIDEAKRSVETIQNSLDSRQFMRDYVKTYGTDEG